MSEDIEALRTEVAELRDALLKLLPLALVIGAASKDSSTGIRELYQALQQAQQQAYSGTFWEVANRMLYGLCERAAHDFPQDEEIQRMAADLRRSRSH